MTNKLKTCAWDAAKNLDTEEDMAAYLEAALGDGNPEFATILKVINVLGLKLHASTPTV